MPEDKRDYGCDEVNLASIPFTRLHPSDKRPEIDITWEGSDTDGQPKTFYLQVSGGSSNQLPDYQSEKVLMALLKLYNDRGWGHQTIRTHPYELCQLLGWNTGGKQYEMIQKSIEQLQEVNVKTNAFLSSETGRYMNVGFHIIASYEIDEAGAGVKHKFIKIEWSNKFLSLGDHMQLKPLNLELYYRLEKPIAMRLMRWADSYFYEGTPARCDVVKLAQVHLGMKPSRKYASQYLQSIQKHLDHLQEINFARYKVVDSNTSSGKELIMQPASKRLLSSEQEKIYEKLRELGISKQQARSLAQAQPSGVIWAIIKRYNEGRRLNKIKHTGWLVKAIEKGYTWDDSPQRYLFKESSETKDASSPSQPPASSDETKGPAPKKVRRLLEELPKERQATIRQASIERYREELDLSLPWVTDAKRKEKIILSHIGQYIEEYLPDLLE